ncbi:acyltransferase [Clostridiaceae bacterium AM27-36LB]|jgi:acetyltransferase-like isoleucine patch superfamily enzyme|nr:acyltransferase [Clostridiaceae bacterium AM27-36LB]
MAQQNSFYSMEELKDMGFKSIGADLSISKKASFYGVENISIGSHVRIDDFCILSGEISIGDYIHIAAYSALYGSDAGIQINEFANISSRVCIYAVTDDYSGESMTSPMIPDEYKNLQKAPVYIGRHAIIGSGSVILPGSEIGEGCAVGSLSLIKNALDAWWIYAGIPAKKLKERSKGLLEKEKEWKTCKIPIKVIN